MIEFKGELSRECQTFIRKKEGIVQSVLFTIAFIILAYPLYLLIIPIFSSTLFVVLIYALIYLFTMVLCFVMPSRKEFLKNIPYKIVIDESEGLIASISADNNIEMNLDNVDIVYDMGTWYLLKFSPGPNYPPRFLCQKDLVVRGTIEDFEKLFAEKIVRIK